MTIYDLEVGKCVLDGSRDRYAPGSIGNFATSSYGQPADVRGYSCILDWDRISGRFAGVSSLPTFYQRRVHVVMAVSDIFISRPRALASDRP